MNNRATTLWKVFFLFALGYPMRSIAQPDGAWEVIFNGKDFKGWTVIERPANVVVNDSSIVMHMTAHTSRHSFIRTNKKYKDFIFEVDFRRDRTMDSGVLFRAEPAPDSAFSALFGYMIKIDPSPTRLWTGGIFLDYGNGINWLHPLEGDNRARLAEKSDHEWNRLRIEAIGNHIKVWLNEVPTANLVDNKYIEGFIAFKIHFLMSEVEKEKMEIAFKNVRIITKNAKKYSRPVDIPVKDTKNKTDITYFR